MGVVETSHSVTLITTGHALGSLGEVRGLYFWMQHLPNVFQHI